MKPAGDRAPIACTLDAGSLAERAAEWRALVASSVVSVEAGTTSVRLVLHESESALFAAAALGQREKRCCGFFGVSVDIEADRRSLVLTVPSGAEDAMAAFVALLTP